MDRKHKVIASSASIIPAAVADIFILFERVRISVTVPAWVDVFILAFDVVWWPIVVLFNYIVWKGKLQIEK